MLFSQANGLGSLPSKRPRACPQVPTHASDTPVKTSHIAAPLVNTAALGPKFKVEFLLTFV